MHGLEALVTPRFGGLATAPARKTLLWGVPASSRGDRPRPAAARPDEDASEHTVIMRPRRLRRGFDATTILVSSVVSGAFVAFAAIAVLV
jgi:hypothetical protein